MIGAGSGWPERQTSELEGKTRQVLPVGAAACILMLALGACGGGGVSSQDVQQAIQQHDQQQKVKDLQQQVNQLKHGQTGSTVSSASSGSSSSGPGISCGGGVSAGPNTTCGFAQNVASAYRESGSSTVHATSPTTHQNYSMTCIGGNPTVCRGGNDASVYIH